MAMDAPVELCYARLVHHLPERTRLRLSPAPIASADAERMADALGPAAGMKQVEINRRTGSVLCLHDQRLHPDTILEALRRADPRVSVLQPGQTPPAPPPVEGPSAVARSLAKAFRSLNSDLLTVSRGSLDLGTLTTLGFVSAGAVEVVMKGDLPMPPSFNLAWWAFRTFMTFGTGTRSPL
jgi:hypothetical protein